MKIGDIVEWLAAAAFVMAAYLGTQRAWPALIVLGICLAYFAQCWSTHPVKVSRPRLRLRKRAKS